MRYIANLRGVDDSRVSRMAKRFRKSGSHSRKPLQGRKKVTSVSDERCTVRNAQFAGGFRAELAENVLASNSYIYQALEEKLKTFGIIVKFSILND